jgi:cytochrome c556
LNFGFEPSVFQSSPQLVKKMENSMLRSLSVCLALIVGGALFAADSLIAQSDPTAIVKERKDLMRSMGKSFKPLVAVVKDESTDLAAAAAAAQTMNNGIVKAVLLFPLGTAKGEAVESRAKPEVWTKSADFDAAAKALIEETAKLVVAAKSGDVDAFKAQFQIVAKACGGCHEGKGKAGGKFRFPKDE